MFHGAVAGLRPSTADPGADLDIRRTLRPGEPEVVRATHKLQRKAVLIGILAVGSYGMLVFSDVGVVLRLLFAAVLVVAAVATATGIMHDGNHGAFSRSRRLNRLLGFTGDLLGGSSWLWRFKHNTLHHASPNVMGMDTDIEQMPFARLAPEQPWRPWHRAQHVYLWFLYGFMALSWLLVSDFRTIISGREGRHRLPRRPGPLELATVVGGKLLHLAWAVVIPLLFCPWWAVLAFYLACSWCVGFTLAVMFQIAHCVDEAEFSPSAAPHRGPRFVVHQLRSTVDVQHRHSRCRSVPSLVDGRAPPTGRAPSRAPPAPHDLPAPRPAGRAALFDARPRLAPAREPRCGAAIPRPLAAPWATPGGDDCLSDRPSSARCARP